MNHPLAGEYIDIHTHGTESIPGVFSVESLLAHENKKPFDVPGVAYTAGIHPWYLTEANQEQMLEYIRSLSGDSQLIAIGEAGFDKLRGPSFSLQGTVFEEQVKISEGIKKPVVIHCVRAWDELLASHKKLKPEQPWLIHGFRGKKELANQLLHRGMYLSFWFEFILRPESAELLRHLPKDRIFLETDGAGVSIKVIYKKVAADLDVSEDELKATIFSNFGKLFK